MHTELFKVASDIAKKNPNYKFHIDMKDAVVGMEDNGEIKPFLAGTITGMVLPYHDTLVNGQPLVHKNWMPIVTLEEVTV